jgi:hypothetical protein
MDSMTRNKTLSQCKLHSDLGYHIMDLFRLAVCLTNHRCLSDGGGGSTFVRLFAD